MPTPSNPNLPHQALAARERAEREAAPIESNGFVLTHEGSPVHVGDVLLDFRGDPATITGGVVGRDPENPDMFGARVFVDKGIALYPGVFACKWVRA